MSFLSQITKFVTSNLQIVPPKHDSPTFKRFEIGMPVGWSPKSYETKLFDEEEPDPIEPFEALVDWFSVLKISLVRHPSPLIEFKLTAKSMILDLDPPDQYHATKKYRNLKYVRKHFKMDVTEENLFVILRGIEMMLEKEFLNLFDLSEEEIVSQILKAGKGASLETFAAEVQGSDPRGLDHYIKVVTKVKDKFFA